MCLCNFEIVCLFFSLCFFIMCCFILRGFVFVIVSCDVWIMCAVLFILFLLLLHFVCFLFSALLSDIFPLPALIVLRRVGMVLVGCFVVHGYCGWCCLCGLVFL